MYFDGACRNNGQPTARSSCGVFFGDYSHPMTSQKLLSVTTNTAAEIQGATFLCKQLIAHIKDGNVVPYAIARGDSNLVISNINRGVIQSYTKHARMPNNAHWRELNECVNEISLLGTTLKWV